LSRLPYKCIFFDLDHTLWDYEKNSFETLQEIFNNFNLKNCGVNDCTDFQQQFRKVNTELWDLYDREVITSDVIRAERFKRILEHFDVYDENLCTHLSVTYLNDCPKKGNLFPHAIETLQYLSQHYQLTIVTNGFEDTQNVKLTAGNVQHYFDHIITSQKAGARKPSKTIFEYAMRVNNVKPSEVVMIGDNLITDIGGAKNAAIDTVFFNPDGICHNAEVKYEISSLAELQNIL
jgi:YjjG family noncanonical pyrimidine nucleotidase